MCSNQDIRVLQSKHFVCSSQDISSFPRRTCAGAHVVVPTEHMWWLPRSTCGGSHGRHMVVPTEDRCWRTVRDRMGWNFGRTDLRISVSKVKFDARADGAVRLAVRRPKPRKIREKKIPIWEFRENDFFFPKLFLQILRPPKIFFRDFPSARSINV